MKHRRHEKGYATIIVLVLTAVVFVILSVTVNVCISLSKQNAAAKQELRQRAEQLAE